MIDRPEVARPSRRAGLLPAVELFEKAARTVRRCKTSGRCRHLAAECEPRRVGREARRFSGTSKVEWQALTNHDRLLA
jgi:hypothetical protein